MARQYTDQERADALAALQMNDGNVKATCRELDIPRRTLKAWRERALASGVVTRDAVTPPPPADWQEINRQAGSKFLALAEEAAEIVKENLAQYRGGGLSIGDLQRVAIIMGICADKGYTFLVGKNGFNVNVDARSVHLDRDGLARFSDDELKALITGTGGAGDGPSSATPEPAQGPTDARITEIEPDAL